MNMLPSSFLPGDPRLINHIVYELKSQGIFDQFRKECIADVDTKPAYQNLSQRVEGSVMNFLKKQKFAERINKNQLREQLRKNITESGFLESGVERIVDQVVNPKINSVFLPKVEDVVYRFLGIERPSQDAQQSEAKPEGDNLLPHDLEAVSPKSVQKGKITDVDKTEATEALNSTEVKTKDESPSFEALEDSKFSAQEENSDDSHLSGMSGLSRSFKKINDVEMSTPVEAAQDISQQSEAVIASEEDTKMEICEPAEISGASDNAMEKLSDKNEAAKPPHDGDGPNVHSDLAHDKEKSVQEDADGKKPENSKRSHDRHKSSRSDKRDHKDKKERSKSESKSKDHKDKTSSKHSSSNKDGSNKKEDTVETDKAKKDDKERSKSRTSSSSKSKDFKNKSEKRDQSKEKSEKDKERAHKDKDRPDKDKPSVDKANKPDKSKSSKDKEKSEKSRVEKATSEKDKSSKIAKEKSSNSSKTENKDKGSSSKEKGPPSSNMHSNPDKSSSKSSKDKPKSASTSNSKDKDKKVDDPKSKSTEKHKKKDQSSSSNDKFNSRKDKEKKSSDDHYSFKDKKSTRRSTDRDSNDGSSKMSRHDSTTETGSNSYKGSSKESSEAFSSGGGESSNSENVEQKPEGDKVVKSPNAEVSPFKYLKPKFASNIHEAMKLMKIRKQLAKMERENQLALSAVLVNEKEKTELETPSGSAELKTGTILNAPDVKQSSNEPESPLKNILKLQVQLEKKVEETQNPVDEKSPMLKSHDISLESFAALEARLALEMSTVNHSSYGYGDDEDYVQYSSITTSPDKQRKLSEKQAIYHSLFEESAPNSREAQIDQPSLDQTVTGSNVENSVACSQASKTRTFVLDQNSDEEIELAGGIQSKSRIRERDSILRTFLLNTEPSIQIPAEKSQNSSSTTVDFLGFSNVDREDVASCKLYQLLEQVRQEIYGLECKAEFSRLVKNAAEQSSDSDHNFGGSKRMNGKKLFISLEKTELDTKVLPFTSISTSLNGGFEPAIFKQNGQKNEANESTPLKINKLVKEWENDDIPCCFFEIPDTSDITNLNRLIERLAAHIERQLEKIANSSSAIIKQTCKRRLQEEERDIEPKFAIKRHRLNEIILDENMCNANLPSHQNFNFPLSPAESEKSGEQKKDEPTPVKPRKSARGSTSQRYSTDELYKPRPVLGCSGSRRKCSRRDSMEQC